MVRMCEQVIFRSLGWFATQSQPILSNLTTKSHEANDTWTGREKVTANISASRLNTNAEATRSSPLPAFNFDLLVILRLL